MKKLVAVIVGVVFCLIAALAHAGTVTLAWDPVTDPSLVGYRLYWGTSSGTYPNKVDVGNVTSKTLTLNAGKYFFAATAVAADPALESGYSNEVQWTVKLSAPPNNRVQATTIELVFSPKTTVQLK